jgi:predicted RNA-binding protein
MNIYLNRNGKVELVIENAERMRVLKGRKIEVISMFDEKKILNATIKEINLHDHKVVLDSQIK